MQGTIRDKSYWVPCSASDPNAKTCNYTAFKQSKIYHPKVTMADIKAALLDSGDYLDNSQLMIKEHEKLARCKGKGNSEVMLRRERSY